MTPAQRLAAWRQRRQLRRRPEQLLEPVDDTTSVFPAARPMAVRGHHPYPERKPRTGRRLSASRMAIREMHAQIHWCLTQEAVRKK